MDRTQSCEDCNPGSTPGQGKSLLLDETSMLLVVFSLVALAIAIASLAVLFYGIIILMFRPEDRSLQLVKKIAISVLIAATLFFIILLLTNTFLAHTNSGELRFSLQDIAWKIGEWLQRRW